MAFIGSGNSILDEIDQAHSMLSPPAQQAIALAHQGIGRGIPEGPQSAGATPPAESAPPSAPVSAPRPIATPTAVRGLGPTPAAPTTDPELTRLTAAPLPGQIPRINADGAFMRMQANPLAHTKADTGQSGTGQIHNPFARHGLQVADAIGSAFLPGLMMGIPGTQLHHEMLVNHREGVVDEADKRATSVVNRQHLGAESTELGARAAHEQAQADELNTPQAKPKAGDPTKTIKTDQGIMQFNPDTGRYDINAGTETAGKETGTVHQLEDGTLVIAHPNGTAAAVTLNGKPVKGKAAPEPKEPKASLEEQIVDEHLQRVHPGETLADARKHTQATPPADHGQNVIDPATNRMVRVEPGGAVPQGAVTPAGMSSQNVPTAATRSMTEAAPKVLNFVDRIGHMIDQQQATLGPAASRWNEFMAGKVGAPNPEFTQLRTDVMLLQTALMRMHVGARGGEQMMQHFHDLIDVSKQSPENLRAALGEIKAYAEEVGRVHGPGAQQQPAAGGGNVDPHVKAYADQYFGGDVGKAQAAIEQQKKVKK